MAEQYTGPDRRAKDDRWHLDRKVPISIIIAIVAQTVGVLVWATKLDSRVERLEQAETQQRDRDVRQDIATHELIDAFNRRLDIIDAKLDRMIERHVKP